MPEQTQDAERESEQALLQAAEKAFAAGDYRTLEAKLEALRAVQSESVVTRVQALRRAVSVDPVHLALLLACLLALVVIAIREGTHASDSEHGAASACEAVVGTSTRGAPDPYERT